MQEKTRKTVLLYGFTDFAGRIMAGNITGHLSGFGIETRIVENHQAGLPVGMVLLGAPSLPEVGKTKDMFPGRMIVMSGIDSEEMEETLLPVFYSFGLRQNVPKAVVTPYNAGWTGQALYKELIHEREEIQKQK